jgi:signal transduction histidine kinase
MRAKQQETEDTLRQRTDDLLVCHKRVDALTNALANDLREPLGRVVSFAQMLEEEYESLSAEDLQHYLQTIVQRGQEIVTVIDELLAVSAAPSTEIGEETSPLDMASVVRGVLERLAHMITEHEATIITPKTWPVSLGHGPWIEEVWANLISNAIRYGGQPPQVELGATKQKGKTIRFWVRDNGQGLAPEEQVRLFTRTDQAPATEYGLGLMLVQRIMGKVGGELGVESEEGQGSVFHFTLPSA